MYSILIVDDEQIIRNGFRSVISIQKDMNVITASNGLEALEILKEEHIDAMILDIRMPKMSGLELLEKFGEKQAKELIIVIVSGYDDFQFAQKAIKFGVEEYILKPTNPDQVKKLSIKLKKRLDQKKYQEEETSKLKKQVEESMPLIKERFFWETVNANISNRQYREKAEFLSIENKGDYYRIILIDVNIDASYKKNDLAIINESQRQVLIKSVENIISDHIREHSHITEFHLDTRTFALICNYSGYNESKKEQIDDLLKEIIDKINDKLGFLLTSGIGGVYQGLNNLKKSYYEAKNALDYRILFGDGNIFNIVDHEENLETIGLNLLIDEIMINIKNEQEDAIVETIKKLFSALKTLVKKVDFQFIYLICNKCVCSLMEVLLEYGLSIDEVYNDRLNPFAQVLSTKTIDELEKYISSLMLDTLERVRSVRNSKSTSLVERIKQYISLNFDKSVSKHQLSEVLNYSANYLGQVFKKETNISISDYINFIRIAEAKKLLKETSLLVYEVAFRVGFNDQHYFSSVFRKVVGVSPSQFKNL